LFFGRDLFKEEPDDGRVFINHNRDIGMMERKRLVVLGLHKTEEFYTGDPKTTDMEVLGNPQEADREKGTNTTAVYQVADDLYMHERYRIDAPATRTNTAPPAKTNAPAAAIESPKTNAVGK